jgi:hypothetical protein
MVVYILISHLPGVGSIIYNAPYQMKEAHLAEITILNLAASSTLMNRLENMHCKLSEHLLIIGYTGSFASLARSYDQMLSNKVHLLVPYSRGLYSVLGF